MTACPHCGGRLFPDRDGDPQCVLCGRYAGIQTPEPLPDVEPEPVYPLGTDKQLWQRSWYKLRRDAGLCTKHGGDVKAVRQGLCVYHADKADERQHKRNKRRYDAAVADGLCACCYKVPTLPGYIHCSRCKEYIRVKSNAWYERKGGRVKCPCGKWFFRHGHNHKYHAMDCPSYPRNQRAGTIVAMCLNCGKALPGSTRRRRYCDELCGQLYRTRPT